MRLPRLTATLSVTLLLGLACLEEAGSGTDTPSPSPSPTQTPSPSASPGPSPAPQANLPAPKPVDPNNLPKSAGSFETAKKWLYEKIDNDHARTLYCGCTYTPDKRSDLGSCGLTAIGTSSRTRIEAEHVFPAARMGRDRPCWNEPLCTKSDGKTFKGRDCCESIDPFFETAHNDLHNLFPEIGTLNGDRGDYDFGVVSGEAREYGDCDFEVDRNADLVEPPEAARGEVARAYLYMEHTYGFPLSDSERTMLQQWSAQDPPEEWERERNRRITEIQGVGNPFIQ